MPSGTTDKGNTAGAEPSAQSDPGTEGTPDIVVPEAGAEEGTSGRSDAPSAEGAEGDGATAPGDAPAGEEAPAEGDEGEGEPSGDAPAEGTNPDQSLEGTETEAPSAGEPTGDAPNVDENADSGLEAPEDEANEGSEDDGIMLLAISDCLEHQFEPVEERKLLNYVIIGSEGHKAVYQIVRYNKCAVCSLIDPESYDSSETITEGIVPHNWSSFNGMTHCSNCGYICLHPGLTWSPSSNDYLWKFNDKETCIPYYYVAIPSDRSSSSCEICGTSGWYIAYDARVFGPDVCDPVPGEPSQHVDIDGDGRCDHCKWLMGCAVHNWVETGRSFGYRSYKNEDGQCKGMDHIASIDYECSYCGATKMEEKLLAAGEFDVPHHFLNGMCENCGYAPSCNHPKPILMSSPSAADAADTFIGAVSSNSNGTHTGMMLVQNKYYCPDCGAEFTLEEKQAVTTECTFKPAYDFGNSIAHYTCTICDYSYDAPIESETDPNTCEHQYWKTRYEYWEPSEGATAHSLPDGSGHVYDKWESRVYRFCLLCGDFTEWDEAGYGMSPVEPHKFNSKGVCLCGAQRRQTLELDHCEHAHTFTKIHEDPSNIVGWNTTEQTHQCVHFAIYDTICEDCDQVIDSERKTVRDEPEAHHFDIFGRCEDCGIYKQPCDHVGTERTIVRVIDKDDDTYDRFHTYYRMLNDEQHYVHGTYSDYEVCTACGVCVSREPVESGFISDEDSQPMPHELITTTTEYADGYSKITACKYCDYYDYEWTPKHSPEECTHPNLKSGATLADRVSYEEIAGDDTMHTKITSKGWQCPGCGTEIYPEDAITKTKARHEYDANGLCQTEGCGHQCAHAEKVLDDLAYEDTINSVDDNNHTITTITQQTWYCMDCGTSGRDTVDEQITATVSHDYYHGVCQVCYHQCNHNGGSAKETTRVLRYGAYKATDDAAHVQKGDVFWQCSICGTQAIDYGVDCDPEPHTYIEQYDGSYRCSTCGHYCTHSDATTSEGDAVNETWDTSAEGHIRLYQVEVTTDCDYCSYKGTSLEARADALAPHTWDATTGKCSVCGYACEHADWDETVTTDWDAYTAEDDATHGRTGVKTTATTCKTCGYATTKTEPVKESSVAHSYENGVCKDCDHACTHNGGAAKVYGEPVPESYASTDATHTPAETTPWTCSICKQTGEDAAKQGEPAAHTYVEKDGAYVCSVCDHVCAHSAAKTSEGSAKNITWEPAAEGHIRHYEVDVTTDCDTCPYVKTVTEARADALAAHTWDAATGKCSVCGYECEHADCTVTEDTKWEDYAADDDATHSRTGVKTTTTTCKTCGHVTVKTEDVEETKVAHTYEDGKCTVCGHVCEHSGDGTAQEPEIEITERTEIEGDDAEHKTAGTKTTKYACTHCGEIDETESKPEPYEGTEAHSYVDGVCRDCGHECAHSGDVEAQMPENVITGRGEIPGDDAQHRVYGITITQYACAECGEIVEDETDRTSYETTEAHSYVGGVCTTCGHRCGHSNTELAQETDEFLPNGVYTPNGTAGHLASGNMIIVVKCNLCGQTWDALSAEPVNVLQEHVYENGVCTVCGFVRPVVIQPTAQPAPADEPVFEEVAPNEVVHNVSTSEELRMATALGTAIEGIQAEYGANVSIAVNHAEEVLSATEYATMTKLPAEEQMMVVLCALGYSDEVQNGLSELGIVLSDEAAALIEEIQQRLQSMSGEELAQYQEALNEFFAEIGGTNAQHTQITLELRVKLPGGYRTERYGFELKDGEWYFTKLSIAGA